MNPIEATQTIPLGEQFQAAVTATIRAVREKERYRSRELHGYADREWLMFFSMCDRFRRKEQEMVAMLELADNPGHEIPSGPMKGEAQ
jgi:hypothetical protein